MRPQPNRIAIGLILSAMMTPAPAAAPQSVGQINYMLQCQGCHKPNGVGIGESVPDLRDYGRQFLSNPAGRQFYVSVPGSAKSPLSNIELAGVLNFIISDILGDKKGQPDSLVQFTDKEIVRYRSIEIDDVKGLRESLVSALTENSTMEEQGDIGEQ